MGLAASQGRLLLLTAKKSDLEFRAQQISQSRLVLAQQQEAVAKKYAEKTSNTCLKMSIKDENGTTKEIAFTTKNFGTNKEISEKYELHGPNGKITIDKNGKVTGGGGLSTEQITALNNEKDTAGADSYLKYLMDMGVITLWESKVYEKGEDGKNTDKVASEAKQTSIAGASSFSEPYDTTDDDRAKAEYDMDMLKIKNKDQRLELDLKGVETQHKAIETETESVQKIIQKNIEVSFKTFS